MISANRVTTVNETDGLPLPKRYWALAMISLLPPKHTWTK